MTISTTVQGLVIACCLAIALLSQPSQGIPKRSDVDVNVNVDIRTNDAKLSSRKEYTDYNDCVRALTAECTSVHNAVDCSCRCLKKGNGIYIFGDCTRYCFPAKSTITLEDRSVLTMDQLLPGQRVLTVTDAGKIIPTKVVAFLHVLPNTTTTYLLIKTAAGQELKVSPRHLIYASKNDATASLKPIYASDLNIGDFLLVANAGHHSSLSTVVDISMKQLNGVYAPLTEHGNLLVDGVLASCYSDTKHDGAHVVMTPLRWFPELFSLLPVSADGVHPYAKMLMWLKDNANQMALHVDGFKSQALQMAMQIDGFKN